jgi:hypothetical protein
MTDTRSSNIPASYFSLLWSSAWCDDSDRIWISIEDYLEVFYGAVSAEVAGQSFIFEDCMHHSHAVEAIKTFWDQPAKLEERMRAIFMLWYGYSQMLEDKSSHRSIFPIILQHIFAKDIWRCVSSFFSAHDGSESGDWLITAIYFVRGEMRRNGRSIEFDETKHDLANVILKFIQNSARAHQPTNIVMVLSCLPYFPFKVSITILKELWGEANKNTYRDLGLPEWRQLLEGALHLSAFIEGTMLCPP